MADETFSPADQDILSNGAVLSNESAGGRRADAGSRLLRDPRLAVAGLALAGVGVIASLIAEWQVITVPEPSEGVRDTADRMLLSGVANLGAFGTSYIILVSLAFTAAVLAMFGRPEVRQSARLAGLALAGTTGAVLLATWQLLHTLPVASGYPGLQSSGLYEELDFTPARGIYAALAGAVLLATALWLTRDGAPALARHRRADPLDEPSKEVMDLTVAPAAPFIH
jgi:hypothetical protein